MIETQIEIETLSKRAELPSELGAAKQLADLVRQFEKVRTGRMPASVSAELVDVSLVITLHGELSPSEIALAQTPDGAAEVQELHRKLFLTSCGSLLKEIEVITGVAVIEATSEVTTDTGTVVQAYVLASAVPASTCTELTSELTSVDPLCGNKERVLDGEG
ncbi:MAG: Na-translocating system protein MpsC family protein [Planctomycetaceae bacterium]